MNTSDIIIAHPSDDKLEALKALKIKFEISTAKPYNKDFVKTIQKGDEDLKNGKGKKIAIDEIDNLWK